MKTIRNNKVLRKIYSLNRWQQIMLMVGLLCTIVIFLQLPFFVATIRFFAMMDKAQGWGGLPAPIDDLKEATRFLLEQSEQDRRKMIAAYKIYTQMGPDPIYAYSKFHLLFLLLFDVSEAYPKEDARYFGGWIIYPEPIEESNINLLWPLGYDDGKLILKAGQFGYMGAPYNALKEYDYFAARFPFRSVEDLE